MLYEVITKEKGITVEVTPSGLSLLAEKSYDPQYGARPVRRKLQDLIEDPIAEKILDGSFPPGTLVSIDRKTGSDQFTFTGSKHEKGSIKLKVAPAKGKLKAAKTNS